MSHKTFDVDLNFDRSQAKLSNCRMRVTINGQTEALAKGNAVMKIKRQFGDAQNIRVVSCNERTYKK